MNEEDFQAAKEAHQLPENQSERTYQDIRRVFLRGLIPVNEKPQAFFLAAQPGSGKTVLRGEILRTSGLVQSTAVINTDDLREFHPAYRTLLTHPIDFALASAIVDPDAVKWSVQLRKEAIAKRLNVLFDVTLGGNAENFVKIIDHLNGVGYDLTISVLAVNPALSRLGIHLRFERQLATQNAGRFVSMQVHDRNFKNLLPNLSLIASTCTLKAVDVYKRKVTQENGQFMNNSVEKILEVRGDFIKPKLDSIIKAIEVEREREWTQTEKYYLEFRVSQVKDLLKERGASPEGFLKDIKDILPQDQEPDVEQEKQKRPGPHL